MRTTILAVATLMLASCGSGGGGTPTPVAGDPIGSNPQGCARFFVSGKAPLIRDPKAQTKTRVLCRRTFAIFHSGVARQPLWVAEALTREQIKLGFDLPRKDSFHPDADLPKAERSELSDYSRSGYDRGHMAPDGDMPSRAAADEAFALSNMSPQEPKLNRGSWANLEAAIRRQTRGGTVYVVTGPLFEGGRIATTHVDGRLLIPTAFFKAVYAEGRGATVFVATNVDSPQWQSMTVLQFRQVHGIDPFPGLEEKYRNVNGTLDGSLNRLAGTAAAKGTNSDGSGTGSGTNTSGYKVTCRKSGASTVQNPTTGEAITPDQYRRWFGRNPDPSETCL